MSDSEVDPLAVAAPVPTKSTQSNKTPLKQLVPKEDPAIEVNHEKVSDEEEPSVRSKSARLAKILVAVPEISNEVQAKKGKFFRKNFLTF